MLRIILLTSLMLFWKSLDVIAVNDGKTVYATRKVQDGMPAPCHKLRPPPKPNYYHEVLVVLPYSSSPYWDEFSTGAAENAIMSLIESRMVASDTMLRIITNETSVNMPCFYCNS